MNAHREWSEIGKMYEELEAVVSSMSIENDESTVQLMAIFSDQSESRNFVGESFYDVVKQAYFDIILGEPETTSISLELSQDLEERLYVLADDEGIPVDELICNMLEEYLYSNQEDLEEDETSEEDGRKHILKEIADMEYEYTKQFSVDELKVFRDYFKTKFC